MRTPDARKSLDTVCAADVVPRAKRWLWQSHLMRGTLELLTGVPGIGKSQVQISYIACVTAGLSWPDGSPGMAPANVLMVSAEDTLEQEIIPRLIAAGADLSRVHFLNCIRTDKENRQFLLGEDLDAMERKINEIGDVALVAIDPITAFMGGKMDAHKVTEVRHQLGPLKDFAERTDVAVSAITHPPKVSSQKAIDQFIGSQAFIAACRIGHVVIPEFDVEDDEADGRKKNVETGRILFALAKHNSSAATPTYAYEIKVVIIGQDPVSGEDIDAARVVWDPTALGITPNEAVAASAGPPKQTDTPANQLQNFLCARLRNGPVSAADIEGEAEAMGFTKNQLEYAKKKLGIVSEKTTGQQGEWIWKIPLVR